MAMKQYTTFLKASDGLHSYPGHSLDGGGGYYPFAEMQSVCILQPADRAGTTWVKRVDIRITKKLDIQFNIIIRYKIYNIISHFKSTSKQRPFLIPYMIKLIVLVEFAGKILLTSVRPFPTILFLMYHSINSCSYHN